jgi:hypothetical protein
MVTTPDIPDFYQHQFWEKLPAGGILGYEDVGGYCRQTSIVDALYPWKLQAPYNNLFPNAITANGTWANTAGNAITTILDKNHVLPRTGMGDINDYLNSRGLGITAALAGQPSLLAMTYVVNQGNGKVSVQLAGHRFEVVSQNNQPYNAFNFYVDQSQQGRTSVLTLRAPNFAQNGLWWWRSFHAVAGAGYDAANKVIQFADPDSNKGNLAANAGWYNLLANGNVDASPNGINAAVARVINNRYSAADVNAAVPLPGNPNGNGVAYTNSDLYGQMTIDKTNGYIVKSSDAGPGENPATGRYTGVKISSIETISPTLTSIAGLIQLGLNRFQATFRLFGDLFSHVNEIRIFPTTPLADTSFSFSLPNWSESETLKDPFGYDRSFGGEDLLAKSGTYLALGQMGVATLDASTAFSSFDVFYHDTLTNQWIVQSVGADPNPTSYLAQSVPEPGSWLILATGTVLTGMWIAERRGMRSVRAASASRLEPTADRTGEARSSGLACE